MARPVSAVPEGYHTITPYLVVDGAAKAIAFYKKAFGAEEVFSMPGEGGRIMHAEIRIGSSMLMLGDPWPDFGSKPPLPNHCSVSIHLYVPDVDNAFKRAVEAGCTVKFPLADMFWGDRFGKLLDPFGHVWGMASHVEDVTPEECARRAAAWKPCSP